MGLYFTDRTRQEGYQKCNRLRFLANEYGGVGLQPVAPDLDMTLGQALHLGFGHTLRNGATELNNSVEASKNLLDSTLSAFYPLSLVRSYKDLSEGLLRAFFKVWLGKILEKYKVLTVEEEMVASLTELIIMGGRADALLGNKLTGEVGLWSVKSTSFWDDSRELEAKFDNQGLSEAWVAEQHYKQDNLKVAWVQMFWIITGQKEDIEIDGNRYKIHNSPVYQGWYKETGLGVPELAHTFKYKVGDSFKTLGKGWTKFNVAEMYQGGIEGWINDIFAGRIQPGVKNPFDDLFKCPPAWYRRQEEIDEWVNETKYQEDRIRLASVMYQDEATLDSTRDRILFDVFRKNRKNCIYMKKKCPFIPLCFGSVGEIDDPFKHGFKWREVNHPIEEEIRNA